MRGYFSRRHIKYWLALAFILLVGLLIQLHNLSPYNFYPDSYQNLTVAQNLKTQHRLAAPMGQGGLVYPDFFGWTRPIYAALIALFSFFGLSLTTAGHVVAVLAGILAILAMFALARSVFGSAKVGLIAASLLAFSFSRVVWSGFIFTEPVSLLMLCLALWRLWSQRSRDGTWFNGTDSLTGLIFALAILTRYEYIAILLPAAFLASKKHSTRRPLTIVITATYIVGMVLVGLRAFTGGGSWVWQQLKSYVIILPIGLVLTGFLAYLSHRDKVNQLLEKWLARLVALLIISGAAALAIHKDFYPGLWYFAAHDPLIAALTIVGLLMMLLGTPAQRRFALMLSTGMVILSMLYYRTNPTIDRYPTHLLPLALLAASYCVWRLLKLKFRAPIAVLLAAAAGLQIFISWTGLHHKDHGIWFKTGYEELSAKKIASRPNTSNLLITSMPEPYYIFTGIPTQSLTNAYPYLYINDAYNDLNVTIIDDMGMQSLFPNFSNFLYNNLSSYQKYQYWVGAPFRYKTDITTETDPVSVYQIKLSELKKLINISKTSY